MGKILVFSRDNVTRVEDLISGDGREVVGLSAADRVLVNLEGCQLGVVDASSELETATAVCRSLRKEEAALPILLLSNRHQLGELVFREFLFDDFVVAPFDPIEVNVRISGLLLRAGSGDPQSVIAYGPLVLNVTNYHASCDGESLGLTYMEYELLKFLASHPGTVFSREILLSRVWGYEYYGGARTVDVHIRRLRSKLGERHEGLIQTVRSVGYRLALPRADSLREG
jgi:two-component system alkaline phosphatase synthesis response regulator PhoP